MHGNGRDSTHLQSILLFKDSKCIPLQQLTEHLAKQPQAQQYLTGEASLNPGNAEWAPALVGPH
jgi:hypothetical protein